MKEFEVYTDGGCSPNPGNGGFGVVILSGGKVCEQRVGGEPETTNNRMEFMAAIAGLESLPVNCKAVVYSDSQLLCKIATGVYKPRKNRDLCEKLFAQMALRTVEFKWVRGHSGNRLNEQCDKIATWSIWQTMKRKEKWGSGVEYNPPVAFEKT